VAGTQEKPTENATIPNPQTGLIEWECFNSANQIPSGPGTGGGTARFKFFLLPRVTGSLLVGGGGESWEINLVQDWGHSLSVIHPLGFGQKGIVVCSQQTIPCLKNTPPPP